MSAVIAGDSGRGAVLVGGAFHPSAVERHSTISAAAARWQLGFAEALAEEWRTEVTCLSYLRFERGSEAAAPEERVGPLRIVPIPRAAGLRGVLLYGGRMLRHAWHLRRRASHVFCYNPLLWTTPWAFLLSLLARAPLVLIVADLEPDSGGGLRQRAQRGLERVLLRLSSRYLVLSPDVRELVSPRARIVVFNGLADAAALAAPTPRYGRALRFVYAGSLSREAGVVTFLRAAEALVQEGAECEFHVFGRGALPEQPSPELQESLTFHGFVSEEELNDFLGQGCVGVNPRQVRGSVNQYNAPYKLLYYLSRGVVTITTASEGVPGDLLDVCIVAGDGSRGVAAAMRRALRMSPAELTEQASRGRERVRTTRSVQVLGRLINDLTRSSAADS